MQVNEKRLDDFLKRIAEKSCPSVDNIFIECPEDSNDCNECWKKFLTEQPVLAMPDHLFTMRNKPK